MSDTFARVAKRQRLRIANPVFVSSSLTARSNFYVTQFALLTFKGGDSHLVSQLLTSVLELH